LKNKTPQGIQKRTTTKRQVYVNTCLRRRRRNGVSFNTPPCGRNADGRWPMAGGRWPWQVAGGWWPVAGGRWPVTGGLEK